MGQINRRAAIFGAAISTAALAVPVVVKAASTRERIDYHLMELAKAMNELNPGMWFAKVDDEGSFVLIHRETRGNQTGVVHQF